MARKNSEGSPRSRSRTTSRSSPSGGASPTNLGHYAGCKWTEPPLPSTLPPPPQHWMQVEAPHSLSLAMARQPPSELDISNQLKVLLKVQA